MKKKLILSLWFLIMGATAITQKTAVHHYLPTMSASVATSYLGYDYVIVDQDLIYNDIQSLQWLKDSGAKVLCYFNIVEWFNPMFPDKPWSVKMVEFLNRYPDWWLHGTDGKRITFWEGMYTMNCASDCPRHQINGTGVNYIEFATDRFIRDVLQRFPFDGVLMDNYWDKVSWLGRYRINQSGIDRNRDGQSDSSEELNAAWRSGLTSALEKIRDFGGERFIITANPGHLFYTKYCSGKMFENFPEIYLAENDGRYQAWYANMNNAAALSGPNFFNARVDNYFFTLCSSQLVDNAVFSYLQNTAYDSKWRLDLGQPLKPAEVTPTGIHCRQFDNGQVFVDPGARKSWVVYQDGVRREE
ncbi:MAG: putative glycoside hydrolase [Patescibacteria group bacterium]|jgi:hypothetical protein